MKTVNWNLDIGSAARKKRRTYPTKTTMNLYFRENRGTKPATILLYVLFVLSGIASLMSFDTYLATVFMSRGLSGMTR